MDEISVVVPSGSNLSGSDWWMGISEEDAQSPLPLDASEGGLWSGNFVPPPPRPIFLDEGVTPDGLTTCDLCSWAWQNNNAFTLDAAMEAPGEIGWVLTLVIVSLVSAVIGAIVMIIALHCRSRMKNAGLSEFEQWKDKIQQNCFFTLDTSPKLLADGSKKEYYNCHRSYTYTSKGKNIRTLKSMGSNKIGPACPARMIIHVKNGDCPIVVQYWKTHVGHTNEIGRTFLSKSIRAEIAETEDSSNSQNDSRCHRPPINTPNDKVISPFPNPINNNHSNNGVWSWLSRRTAAAPPQLDPPPTSPAENHYTHMDETYSGVGEALYAELDRESTLDRDTNSPAYQNSAYTDPDAPPSSAPSSAYYSDLSVTTDRAYEVVGLATMPIWDGSNVAVSAGGTDNTIRRPAGRLAAISETVTVPSDYV